MTESTEPKPYRYRYRHKEMVFGAVSAGFFFLLVGVIFIITPNLFDAIVDFFQDFDLIPVPHLTNVLFPAPANPAMHSVVYGAALKFGLVWGIFQIAILVFRFILRSPISKISDTSSNIVFWLGATYLVSVFLIQMPTALQRSREQWFTFWAAIVILIGVTLIVRAAIMAARMATRK